MAKNFRRERDHIDRFEIGSRFILALAASIVALMSFLFQRVDQQRALDDKVRNAVEQIRAKNAVADLSRRTYEVQVAASLVPIVVRGAAFERRKALLALAQIAPALAADISAVLQQTAESESERQFAKEINIEASDREITTMFIGYLHTAREFLGRRLHQEACSEFLKAWNNLPDAYAQRIDDFKIESGQTACSLSVANYVEGAADLQDAFKRIQTP